MKKNFLFFLFLSLGLSISQNLFSQIKITDNELITEFIAKKRSFNKTFEYGYRIQLYNGFEIDTKKTQAKFRIDFPEIKTYLTYSQPEWKIQVGTYRTKLEADRVLLQIKRKYGGAIVIPLGK